MFFSPEVLLGRIIGLIIGFSLHEWAHAWTAYRLGDNTAYFQGRLTVNPRAHIEPVGILMAIFAGFGWAKPVPVNPRAFYPNEQRGLMLVSLAGPVMNLIIAAVFAFFIRLMWMGGLIEGDTRVLIGSGRLVEVGMGSNGVITFLYQVLGTVVLFNLVLFLFNLLPFSPLDGYKIAVGVLPPEQSRWLMRYEKESTLVLFMLLIMGILSRGQLDILWAVLGPPLRFLYEALTHFYPSFS